MSAESVLLVVFVFLAAALGVRATWHVGAIHREEEPPRSLITGTLFAICLIVTAAGVFYAVLGVRGLLGLPPLTELRPLSVLIAALILLIPAGIDRVVRHIQGLRT